MGGQLWGEPCCEFSDPQGRSRPGKHPPAWVFGWEGVVLFGDEIPPPPPGRWKFDPAKVGLGFNNAILAHV